MVLAADAVRNLLGRQVWQPLVLDHAWHALRCVDATRPAIQLTEKEYALLCALFADFDQLVRAHQLVAAIWGDEGRRAPETFDVELRRHVLELRKKMLRAGWGVSAIANQRGYGYGLSLRMLQSARDDQARIQEARRAYSDAPAA